jgi:hypothetical protein
MSLTQTRRRFLTNLSLAAAPGLLRSPRALAAEEALETARRTCQADEVRRG